MTAATAISLESCMALIRDIVDFPKPGIVFKDITPLLANGPCFHAVIERIAGLCEREGLRPDVLACPEARGFIFGAVRSSSKTGCYKASRLARMPAELRV